MSGTYLRPSPDLDVRHFTISTYVGSSANEFADSVRKSSRATKGQHRKSFEPADTPTAKARGKGKGSKAAKQTSSEPTPPEEDEDSIIRCICGYVVEDEDDDRKMICCDSCTAWQHNECMEVSLDDDELPEQYFCELCRPDLHQALLEKVERGEKPWEERERKRQEEEEEARLRKKKGKKGKKGRVSNVKLDVEPEPAKTNGVPDTAPTVMPPPTTNTPTTITREFEPRAESVSKRKFPEDAPEETKSPSQQVRSSVRNGVDILLTHARNPRAKYAKYQHKLRQSLQYRLHVESRAT